MVERLSTGLKRHWYCTPGMEWLLWEDWKSHRVFAFQIVLTEKGLFVEWRADRKLRWGRHDDGEETGRHKKTPMLVPGAGGAGEVVEIVLQVLAATPDPHPVPKKLAAFVIETLMESRSTP